MSSEDKADDNGVDLLQEKDFQLVISKKMKGKKAMSLGNNM